MPKKSVDVAVIGAGSTGLRAYWEAFKANKSAVLIDHGPYGTTCARVGCMPSKLLIAAAETAHITKTGDIFGVKLKEEPIIDGIAVMKRLKHWRNIFVDSVIESMETDFNQEDLIKGTARFKDDHTLIIEDQIEINAKTIVIATGSRPHIPESFLELGNKLITSDEIFYWDDLPKSVAVFGAGSVGLELGQALHRLGVQVNLFNKGDSIGPLTDPEVRQTAEKYFREEFPLFQNAQIKSMKANKDGVEIIYVDDTGEEKVNLFDVVLAATGRIPNVEKLGLENTSLKLNAHKVPEFDPQTTQTSVKHIFIAGDASNHVPLLHEAADEGRIAGKNASYYPEIRAYIRRIPLGIVFTDPQIAIIGKSFKELCQSDGTFAIGEVSYERQGRSQVMNVNKGLLRLYGCRKSGCILGAEMVGPRAEHLSHLLVWIIQMNIKVSDVLELPFYHPTIEEGLHTALKSLNRALTMGPEPAKPCLDAGPGA